MARHRKFPRGAGIASGQLTLPEDKYYGFAIGSESDHDLIDLLNAPELGTVRLAPRMVVPIRPTTFAPEFALVRDYDADTVMDARFHVVGFTCPQELAAGPQKRSPFTSLHQLVNIALSGTTTVRIPFAGRRHARIAACVSQDDGDAITAHYIAISGVDHDSTSGVGVTRALVAAELMTSPTVKHVGGTDNEEIFSELRVTVSDDDAAGAIELALWVECWGEVGD